MTGSQISYGCLFLTGAGTEGHRYQSVRLKVLSLCWKLAFGIKTVENKQSKTTAVARIQVPFSRTSVVCLTPINWLLKPATFPASPPPFGF